MTKRRLFSVIALLGTMLAALSAFGGYGTRKAELFPQGQNCQSELTALRIRFPYRKDIQHQYHYMSDPDAKTRLVTNCRRFGFQYFLETMEPTGQAYWLKGQDKFYAINSNEDRDLIVHVMHVQPTTSLSDPTISSNLYILASASELQNAYVRFDGTRDQAADRNFDYFRPYTHISDFKHYFLSKENAKSEFVGICNDTTACSVLVYSQRDSLAFTLTFPREEIKRLDKMVDRTLTLLRRWRLPVASGSHPN